MVLHKENNGISPITGQPLKYFIPVSFQAGPQVTFKNEAKISSKDIRYDLICFDQDGSNKDSFDTQGYKRDGFNKGGFKRNKHFFDDKERVKQSIRIKPWIFLRKRKVQSFK